MLQFGQNPTPYPTALGFAIKCELEWKNRNNSLFLMVTLCKLFNQSKKPNGKVC